MGKGDDPFVRASKHGGALRGLLLPHKLQEVSQKATGERGVSPSKDVESGKSQNDRANHKLTPQSRKRSSAGKGGEGGACPGTIK